MYQPLVYAPDLDTAWSVLPGGIQRMVNFVPTRRGTYASWACDDIIATASSSDKPRAAGIVRKTDGSARMFVFNVQSIKEFTNSTTLTDRSGTTYSASTETWTWTQFGDSTIATNLLNNVQVSTSGAFSDLGGTPPKAQLVASNLGFVMLANYNDGTAYPDGWACCDIEDITDWTVTATNQADRGRLYDTPGPIRALVALRDSFVAFKDDSMYVAEYVGDPNTTIWSWRLIADKVGCSAPHGVCAFGDRLYFVHRTGFYVFDGASLQRIGRECTNDIFERVFAVADGLFTRVQTIVDHLDGTLFFSFSDNSADNLLAATYTYNVETGRWGGRLQDYVFTIASGSGDYATCAMKCTQSDVVAWNSSLIGDNLRTCLYVGQDGSSNLVVAAGAYPAYGSFASGGYEITTGPIGDGKKMIRVIGAEPLLRTYDTTGGTPTGGVTVSKDRASLYDVAPTTGLTWNATENRYDSTTVGRYVVVRMLFNGTTEIGGLWVEAQSAGAR